MNNVPNPNVGDIITVYSMGDDVKATVIRKGKLSNPRFNTWTVTFQLEFAQMKMDVCWNPMVQAFTGFDRN
jgi:hypothetical protein